MSAEQPPKIDPELLAEQQGLRDLNLQNMSHEDQIAAGQMTLDQYAEQRAGERLEAEQAGFARMMAPLNDEAQARIYGNQPWKRHKTNFKYGNRQLLNGEGEVVLEDESRQAPAPAEEVVEQGETGRIEHILHSPRYGKTEAERKQAAKEYEAQLDALRGMGLELVQAERIVEARLAEQQEQQRNRVIRNRVLASHKKELADFGHKLTVELASNPERGSVLYARKEDALHTTEAQIAHEQAEEDAGYARRDAFRLRQELQFNPFTRDQAANVQIPGEVVEAQNPAVPPVDPAAEEAQRQNVRRAQDRHQRRHYKPDFEVDDQPTRPLEAIHLAPASPASEDDPTHNFTAPISAETEEDEANDDEDSALPEYVSAELDDPTHNFTAPISAETEEEAKDSASIFEEEPDNEDEVPRRISLPLSTGDILARRSQILDQVNEQRRENLGLDQDSLRYYDRGADKDDAILPALNRYIELSADHRELQGGPWFMNVVNHLRLAHRAGTLRVNHERQQARRELMRRFNDYVARMVGRDGETVDINREGAGVTERRRVAMQIEFFDVIEDRIEAQMQAQESRSRNPLVGVSRWISRHWMEGERSGRRGFRIGAPALVGAGTAAIFNALAIPVLGPGFDISLAGAYAGRKAAQFLVADPATARRIGNNAGLGGIRGRRRDRYNGMIRDYRDDQSDYDANVINLDPTRSVERGNREEADLNFRRRQIAGMEGFVGGLLVGGGIQTAQAFSGAHNGVANTQNIVQHNDGPVNVAPSPTATPGGGNQPGGIGGAAGAVASKLHNANVNQLPYNDAVQEIALNHLSGIEPMQLVQRAIGAVNNGDGGHLPAILQGMHLHLQQVGFLPNGQPNMQVYNGASALTAQQEAAFNSVMNSIAV